MATERLSKFLAHSGIASRRKCEQIIKSGRVKVNGAVVADPAHPVDRTRNLVLVDNRPLRPRAAPCYVALYKPPGYLSDLADIEGKDRPLARRLIPLDTPLLPVGRLDYNSEGLMIFTNDGRFANLLTHPRYEVDKEYHVKLSGALTRDDLKRALLGLRLDQGRPYRFKSIALLKKGTKNAWYRVTLTEGRYRHIRKVAEALSHKVLRLRRVRIDGILLGALKAGQWAHIDPRDIARFLPQQGSSRQGQSKKDPRNAPRREEPFPRPGDFQGIAAKPADNGRSARSRQK
jgi:pseudouridine synthase